MNRKAHRHRRRITGERDSVIYVSHTKRRVQITVLGHTDKEESHSAIHLDDAATEKLIERLTNVLIGMRAASKKRAERRAAEES